LNIVKKVEQKDGVNNARTGKKFLRVLSTGKPDHRAHARCDVSLKENRKTTLWGNNTSAKTDTVDGNHQGVVKNKKKKKKGTERKKGGTEDAFPLTIIREDYPPSTAEERGRKCHFNFILLFGLDLKYHLGPRGET